MVGIIRYTISLFAIGFASLAWAVSIYDVIELSRQGYSDAEVVNIIRTTGSVFELTAEDIPRLKNLGVSDAIIRSMLMAEPAGSPETESFLSDPVNDFIEEITPITSERFYQADSANYEHAASPVLTPHHFAVQSQTGHAGRCHAPSDCRPCASPPHGGGRPHAGRGSLQLGSIPPRNPLAL